MRTDHNATAGEREPQESQESQAMDEDIADFEAAARRTLEQQITNSFIWTYKPVLDDAPYRAFDTMEAYRAWCEAELPDWLGYGRV